MLVTNVNQDHAAQRSRLLWQCRRGMLELDIVLHSFLDRYGAMLSPSQQDSFERLLGSPDQQLQSWLEGTAIPPQPDLRELVERIRRHPVTED